VKSPQLRLVDEEILPATWSGPHVSLRICDAMRTLRLIPMGRVRGYGRPWPPYAYEWEDLLAQQEQGELERTQQLQNRVHLMPSWREITCMELAICWPAQFLNHAPELMVAVNAVALAHALDRDAGWVAVKRGGYADTWRQRHDSGCMVIASSLRNAKEPVF
jgi:hypothetical protein